MAPDSPSEDCSGHCDRTNPVSRYRSDGQQPVAGFSAKSVSGQLLSARLSRRQGLKKTIHRGRPGSAFLSFECLPITRSSARWMWVMTAASLHFAPKPAAVRSTDCPRRQPAPRAAWQAMQIRPMLDIGGGPRRLVAAAGQNGCSRFGAGHEPRVRPSPAG
jgi:hypothetical protein